MVIDDKKSACIKSAFFLRETPLILLPKARSEHSDARDLALPPLGGRGRNRAGRSSPQLTRKNDGRSPSFRRRRYLGEISPVGEVSQGDRGVERQTEAPAPLPIENTKFS